MTIRRWICRHFHHHIYKRLDERNVVLFCPRCRRIIPLTLRDEPKTGANKKIVDDGTRDL